MAKRLLLLRHAQILADHVGQLIGASDVPLEPFGDAQARALAAYVRRWTPQACYCSPMQRCRQTAAVVAAELPLQIDPDLREIDFGAWEKRTFADAARENPALADHWVTFDADFAFPGGDSLDGFLCRVRSAAERLIQAKPQTVLAITHGGVIRTMICHFLGIEPRKYLAFDVPYAAMAVIDLFDAPPKGTVSFLSNENGDSPPLVSDLFDGKGVLSALVRPDLAEGGDG